MRRVHVYMEVFRLRGGQLCSSGCSVIVPADSEDMLESISRVRGGGVVVVKDGERQQSRESAVSVNVKHPSEAAKVVQTVAHISVGKRGFSELKAHVREQETSWGIRFRLDGMLRCPTTTPWSLQRMRVCMVAYLPLRYGACNDLCVDVLVEVFVEAALDREGVVHELLVEGLLGLVHHHDSDTRGVELRTSGPAHHLQHIREREVDVTDKGVM